MSLVSITTRSNQISASQACAWLSCVVERVSAVYISYLPVNGTSQDFERVQSLSRFLQVNRSLAMVSAASLLQSYQNLAMWSVNQLQMSSSSSILLAQLWSRSFGSLTGQRFSLSWSIIGLSFPLINTCPRRYSIHCFDWWAQKLVTSAEQISLFFWYQGIVVFAHLQKEERSISYWHRSKPTEFCQSVFSEVDFRLELGDNAMQLRNDNFDAMFFSPLKRAAKTGSIIWGDREGDTTEMASLREIDLYSFQVTLQTIHAIFKHIEVLTELYVCRSLNIMQSCIECQTSLLLDRQKISRHKIGRLLHDNFSISSALSVFLCHLEVIAVTPMVI